MGLLSSEAFMYAHEPLQSRTRYRVRDTGTLRGGAAKTFDFTFTTGN